MGAMATFKSTLGQPFLVVSTEAFIDGIKPLTPLELEDVVHNVETMVEEWELSQAAVLADFEG